MWLVRLVRPPDHVNCPAIRPTSKKERHPCSLIPLHVIGLPVRAAAPPLFSALQNYAKMPITAFIKKKTNIAGLDQIRTPDVKPMRNYWN